MAFPDAQYVWFKPWGKSLLTHGSPGRYRPASGVGRLTSSPPAPKQAIRNQAPAHHPYPLASAFYHRVRPQPPATEILFCLPGSKP